MRTYKTTYTKHYYIEGERICSKIGGGFQWAHTPPTSNPIDFIEGNPHTCSMHLREMVDRNTQCAEYDGEMDIRPELAPAHNNGNEYEKLQYFYHSDHLGSASFVTDRGGNVVQHLQYLPYGELFVSQRNSDDFDSRYKFTAKELDNETSYTYFGARYYDSELSGWLSVDPMSDKYPSLSPYCYTANNPVVLIDPNGEKVYIVGDAADEATGYLSTENIKVKRNSKTGELSVKGKAKNENEKLLVEAIKSSEVIVELTVNNSNVIGINEDGTREISEHGGSFLGNEVFFNECGEAIGAIAKQYVSMDKLKELFAQDKIGASIYHEITEAFQGGLCSIELGESAKKATTGVDNPKYDLAHNLATPQPLFEKDVIHQTYKNQSKSVFEQFLEFSTQPNNKFNRKSSF